MISQKLQYWQQNKCMFVLNCVLMFVLVKYSCKLRGDGDNAETCGS